jgi:hypothetical protein
VKYHGEALLNNEYTFKKMKDSNVKQVLLGMGPSGGGRVKDESERG